jgi:flagellar biosynthesis anti-sigma factor FlgM
MAGSSGRKDTKTKKEKKSPSLVKNLERFDLKKVNQLREAIREGRYEVDFEKLAEKFLKDL